MLTSGIVKGFKVEKNRDGEKNVIMLQVEMSAPDDVQSVEQINHGGEQYNPPVGSQVVILNLGDAWKVAIASDDDVEPDALPGEKEIYSNHPATGAKLAFVRCTFDGIKQLVKINGEADFAVRFNALQIAFNQLKADYDGHKHKYTAPLHPGSPTDTGAPTAASTADISPAKVEDIKLTGATP